MYKGLIMYILVTDDFWDIIILMLKTCNSIEILICPWKRKLSRFLFMAENILSVNYL